jgi:magnesium transporter
LIGIENESGFIADENLKYFHDLNDLVVQAAESIEIYQMMLNDQMISYHANLDLRANEIMKVLTFFRHFSSRLPLWPGFTEPTSSLFRN